MDPKHSIIKGLPCIYFVRSSLKSFHWIRSTLSRYSTDTLKKKFDAEKIFFDKLLFEFSLDLFNTLQICYRHIEDVHEEVFFVLKNIF